MQINRLDNQDISGSNKISELNIYNTYMNKISEQRMIGNLKVKTRH